MPSVSLCDGQCCKLMGICELPSVYQYLKAVTQPENCLYGRNGIRGETHVDMIFSEVVESFKHRLTHVNFLTRWHMW